MTTTIAVPTLPTGVLSADDPRYHLGRATQIARLVCEHLTTDNATNPSPCTDWDARHVAGHIIAVLDRIAGFAHGRHHEDMVLVHDLPVSRIMVEFDRAAADAHNEWADDSVLGRILTLPFAEVPGAITASIYSAELLIHAWDLATALGVEVEWPADLATMATAVVQQGIPAERGPDAPFDEVVPASAEAAPIHHLVGWMGRNPAAWN